MFKNSDASAIAATANNVEFDYKLTAVLTLVHYMTAGNTTPMTFKINIGGQGAGNNIYLNGDGTGTQLFGGVAASSMTITELKP